MEGAGQPGNTAGHLASGYRQEDTEVERRNKMIDNTGSEQQNAVNYYSKRMTSKKNRNKKAGDINKQRSGTMLHGLRQSLRTALFLLEDGEVCEHEY